MYVNPQEHTATKRENTLMYLHSHAKNNDFDIRIKECTQH